MQPVAAIGPGAMLGRYQVLSYLAAGGMAEIYLARAIGLEGFERYVVVKCIKQDHARDERFVKMFIDEARVSAQLHHQNIAQVYDIGQERGAYYFAMEYLHGENVRELLHKVALARGEVPIAHALTIVCGAAAGLHYAHEKRGGDGQPLDIVHRDVSPSNIVVTFDGAVKVVDFGIAKAATRMTETQSGSLKGKIAYMSPEQCRGGALDRRSDVFALGIVLYELTTVTRLFRGASDYVTMNKIVSGDIDRPSTRRAGYPAALEAIVMRALAKEPGDRYASAGEMRDALVAFAKAEGVSLSTIGLEAYVRELFGERPEPWASAPTPTPASEPTPLPPPATAAPPAMPEQVATSTPDSPAIDPNETVTSQGSLALSALEVQAPPAPPRSSRSALALLGAVVASAALVTGVVALGGRGSTARDASGDALIEPATEAPNEAPNEAAIEAPTEPAPSMSRAAPVDADVDAGVGAGADTGVEVDIGASAEVAMPATATATATAPPSSTPRRGRSRRTSPRSSSPTASSPPSSPSPSSRPSSPAPAASAHSSAPPIDAGARLRDPSRLRPED